MASRVLDADGQVSANQCQHEATNQYNAAPPSALNADIMDSGAHSLSIKILYQAAKGTDLEFLEDAVVKCKWPSQEKSEGVAYAYACVLCRLGDDDVESSIPAVPKGLADVSPLTQSELLGAARHIVEHDRLRSSLCKLVHYTINFKVAKTHLEFHDIQTQSDLAARGRLARYLKRVADTCTWKYGDGYIENRIRALLPNWAVSTTPKGLAPYKVVTDLMFSTANDVIREILDTPIKSHLTNYSDKRHGLTALFAAVAVLQETTGGKPELNYNTDILRHSTVSEPSIAVAANFVGKHCIGVATGNVIEYSSRWSAPPLDVLLELLVASRDLNVGALRDVANAIIDNDTNSPAYAYVALSV